MPLKLGEKLFKAHKVIFSVSLVLNVVAIILFFAGVKGLSISLSGIGPGGAFMIFLTLFPFLMGIVAPALALAKKFDTARTLSLLTFTCMWAFALFTSLEISLCEAYSNSNNGPQCTEERLILAGIGLGLFDHVINALILGPIAIYALEQNEVGYSRVSINEI